MRLRETRPDGAGAIASPSAGEAYPPDVVAAREARLDEIVRRIRSGMLQPTTLADVDRILYGGET